VRGGDSISHARARFARNAHVTPSSVVPPLDYERLRDTLAAAGAVVAVAELHGGVCGALCTGGVAAARHWLAGAFDDGERAAPPGTIAEELEELVTTSARMLEGDDLKFEPLQPSDEAPLAEQVEALAAWCQGFLNGIGTTAPAAARGSPENGALGEILRDFAEISRAGLSDDEAEGRDSPDFALAEIHEYVRVSAQIAFEELASLRAGERDVH
jgi:uncharacterized protein YgfB (UPF0149 family)